jgi:hypothetical protein
MMGAVIELLETVEIEIEGAHALLTAALVRMGEARRLGLSTRRHEHVVETIAAKLDLLGVQAEELRALLNYRPACGE